MMQVLSVSGLTKSFDGLRAVDDFSLTIGERTVIGLIGPNGAGKTTLFNVVTGFLRPEAGQVLYKGADIGNLNPHHVSRLGIARTFQNLRLIRWISVLDNILLAFPNSSRETLLGALLGRRARLQEQAHREKALALLDFVGLKDKADELAESLSYGQQKLLSLAVCMASGADLYLLDEPVAGLDPEMVNKILRLIKTLPGQGKTVLLIEHNIEAVMEVADRIVVMAAGRKVTEGEPRSVLQNPQVIEVYLA